MVRLSGWGMNVWGDCRLLRPASQDDLLGRLDRRGTIPRGLGRSYGDAAINDGGQVLSLLDLNCYLSFDQASGMLVCEAGVTLEQIIRSFAPRGWFPMITPGTKMVTIGGCIANDIHGKAHHVQGSFSSCVESMTILLASGDIVTASRTENAELFWATFGGMGLLGVILTATIRLRRIESTYFRQKSVRAKNLEQMLALLDELDRQFPYSVATLDVFARGARIGSGVVTAGDHASLAELPKRMRADPLSVRPAAQVRLPFVMPDSLLNPVTLRPVNWAIQCIQASAAAFGHYEGFFYPLDGIGDWNRAYGRRGFTQYQLVVPFADGERRLHEILSAVFSAGELPFLNILKRFGKADEGWLSFPQEGYTLAIDFPVREGTADFLRRLDRMVLDAGGRLYLAKDSYLEKETFRAMYPALDRWLALKAKYDPDGIFTSNLAQRLGLVPGKG